MPNWCSNRLKIYGSKKDLHKFIKDGRGKEDVIYLTSYIPMPRTFKCDTTNHPEKFPKQVKYQMKKYGCVGWYDWGIKYLGTKWDAELSFLDDRGFIWGNLDDIKEDNTITFLIETAWSPPIEWLKKVQEKYPNLKFHMYFLDEGMGFSGTAATKIDNDNKPYIDLF